MSDVCVNIRNKLTGKTCSWLKIKLYTSHYLFAFFLQVAQPSGGGHL